MDLVILQEPLKELLLALKNNNLFNSGYLLGRYRGLSVIVEKVYFVHWKKLLEPAFFQAVEASGPWSVLGVFELGPTTERKKLLLHPLFTEKIYLSLSLDRKKEIKAQARKIQFNGHFSFIPLEHLIFEMEGKNEQF
ncbi:MAG: hypothetical protein H5U07_02025 [Candidatus Aminicenantes bacterium]|nr:hypothetical protein [Candidatus Aminicenantes bacterium]